MPTSLTALGGLPGWERQGDEIMRTFECASFPDAVAFVVRVGFFAEAADHHPDLDVRWRKVRVALDHARRGRTHPARRRSRRADHAGVRGFELAT